MYYVLLPGISADDCLSALQFAADPEAYGATSTGPSLVRSLSSVSSTESDTSDSSSGHSEAQFTCRLSHRRPKKCGNSKQQGTGKRLQSIAVPILAIGAAILIGRHSNSCSNR